MTWDSKGDLVGVERNVVDPGNMTVSGKIDGKSSVTLVSTGGSIMVNDKIDGTSFVFLVASGAITIDGRIDGNSVVIAFSTGGSITITGKVDGSSQVWLKAAGPIAIGTKGGDEDKKIDGSSSVSALAGGNITLGSHVHASTVDFSSHGSISTAGVDNGASIRYVADNGIAFHGSIDGASRVELVSNRGLIRIDGKIDGNSKVYLTAEGDVDIGVGKQFDDENHKIDGNSSVTAIAGGNIILGSRIAKDHTWVDFAASGTVSIGEKISDGATVRLLTGGGKITMPGAIDGSSTKVTSWPKGAWAPTLQGGAKLSESEWATPEALRPGTSRDGYWWENWTQTFGYVAPFRVVPRSVDDISAAVIGSGNVDRPDRTPVKAVGGGWSFTDAALPFGTAAEVQQASLLLRGAWQRQDMRDVLLGLNDLYPMPMDLAPEAVTRNLPFSTAYDQPTLRQVTMSGAQLPGSMEVRLIDTRSLASSLQCEFEDIQAPSDVASRRHVRPEILFHVEAGITMADLQQLLDHQNPRLAIAASGGSPGATLAGALATATHGGEFTKALLVDCVRAVHLVGPGGLQWWIEGDVPVAKPSALLTHYKHLNPGRIIRQGWNGIPGLTAQDVLDAVVVSMGTMGVIYSMVIAVVPQFGIHQVVHPTTWADLLSAAGTTENDLRSGIASANQAVLNALMDGVANGTGIAQANNIYIDLAVNPLTRECWIVNREETPALPDDANFRPAGINDLMTALSRSLSRHSVSELGGNKFFGRIFDFFYWGTDALNVLSHIGNAGNLLNFITRQPDPLAALLAAGSAQTVVNVDNWSQYPDRGHKFIGDVLTGFFHALEGTQPGINADNTGVSYKVGAIGWPDSGIPGRGLEIALDETNAFTFLQTVLFDDVLDKMVTGQNLPFFGYISVRVCPPTRTLMGMQQYSPLSVMIEVVSYRSPAANVVMDAIQKRAIAWSGPGPKPLLHWGLENDQVTNSFLKGGPLGQPYKPGFTRLDAFKQIRDYLREGNVPVFDNNFSMRIGV